MEHTVEQLKKDLSAIGIRPGDTVLMHSSFKSLGGVEDGAVGFFRGFLDLLGSEGTLVLPTLTYAYTTREHPFFDVTATPSCVGYLTEYFRTQVKGTVRSVHPTHSCAAIGKQAQFLLAGHENDTTPVGANSPFYKLPLIGGKILMLGCGLKCCTSMHGVEETVEPDYLFANQPLVEYRITGYDGKTVTLPSKRHAFTIDGVAHYAQRYDRIASVLDETQLKHGQILSADSYLIDAAALWSNARQRMLKTPHFFVDQLIP